MDADVAWRSVCSFCAFLPLNWLSTEGEPHCQWCPDHGNVHGNYRIRQRFLQSRTDREWLCPGQVIKVKSTGLGFALTFPENSNQRLSKLFTCHFALMPCLLQLPVARSTTATVCTCFRQSCQVPLDDVFLLWHPPQPRGTRHLIRCFAVSAPDTFFERGLPGCPA